MPLDPRLAGLKWRDFRCVATDRHMSSTFCVYHRRYTRTEVIQTWLIPLFNQINSSLTMSVPYVTSDRYIRFPVFPTPWGISISDESLSYYDLTVAGRTDKARPPMADHQHAHYHAVRPRHDLDSRFVNWSAHSQKMGPLSLITSQTQT
jgi:hypothetical protein